MYHDLNVNVPPEAREKTIATLTRLGYNVAAFTTTVSNSKKIGPEQLPKQNQGISSSTGEVQKTSQSHTDPRKRRKELTVLERVTLQIDDASQLGLLTSPALSSFDLVAVRPTTEKLLQQCLQFDIDIVSLDFGRRQAFQVKRPQVHVAAEKGVLFEISYALGLRDAASRKFLVSNAGTLCRATGGKHVLLSSGARSPMELRGPHDVINLGVLFDLDMERARVAVTSGAEGVVHRGDVRARAFKGVVRIEKVTEEENETGCARA